jgi:hypothetical protein
MHAAVQAGEGHQERDGEAGNNRGPPQPRALDAECEEGESEI